MLWKLASYACLVAATILFPASTFTFKKIWRGSKSHFAYLLVAFTFAAALNNLTWFFMDMFPNE